MNDREGMLRYFLRQYSAEVFSGQFGSKVVRSFTAGTVRTYWIGCSPSWRDFSASTFSCFLRRFVMLFL